ncbi:MAG TPA: TIGR03435 family protein [Bryobacteraceae bacterium]|nr:TIGR03435 family protein [Bryobacteraceae bacterium]
MATIKPSRPGTSEARTSIRGNTIIYHNTTLLNALARAFELKSANQVAGPAWVFENRYDIAAKAPENTPKEEFPRMMRALLIERFKLVLHHETRELPGYALVKGRRRLKLRENEGSENSSVVMIDGRREMRSMNMAALAQFTSLMLRRPVVDATGLAGHYDFALDMSREESGKDSAPSIFTVIAGLGLKLDPRKMSLDVIVIEDGSKTPTENQGETSRGCNGVCIIQPGRVGMAATSVKHRAGLVRGCVGDF